ncbi:hypothetical protein EVAR_99150_1 [Eumeta japonica]|uniref:Uncharacterized protein n=1 Tax=Eumeta variegata TaxID=151549 RepID=A0A4C1YBW1_EUMVA|nr:hypothetical protein EVAR_99150_1 [Eumeta japonica]
MPPVHPSGGRPPTGAREFSPKETNNLKQCNVYEDGIEGGRGAGGAPGADELSLVIFSCYPPTLVGFLL